MTMPNYAQPSLQGPIFPRAAGSWKTFWRSQEAGAVVARIFSIELTLVVLTQKLAIPLGGKAQVALALLLHLAAYVYLGMKGLLRIDTLRLSLFLAMMACAFIFHIRLPATDFSPTSIGLVFVILAFYAFVIPIERRHYLTIIRVFILLAVIAGALVWLEWAFQIVGLGKPNLNLLIPYEFQYRDYNYINRMWFGPIRYKPNGIFFLETSHASQFIATGLICEFVFFRRLRYLAFLTFSLLGTFGGTGITILLFCAPFLAKHLRIGQWLIALIGLPVALLVAMQIGFLDNAMKRLDEFDKTNASGNIRFIMPIQAVGNAANGPADDFILGKGAGSMPRGSNTGLASFAWAPYAKVVVEYGIIVAVFWFALICLGVFRPGVPFVVSWALFIQYHLLNGALAVPIHTIYCLLLSGAFLIVRDRVTQDNSFPTAPAKPSHHEQSS